jgi:uncharacterized iron-regulated membrane protein
MRWLSANRLDLATAGSVVLSAVVGLVGNLVVGGWGWALVATFTVLVVCLAGLEVVRRRADRNAVARSAPRPGTVISDHQVRIVGRDMYDVHVGGAVFAGIAAVFAVALVLSGTLVTIARQRTTAASPPPTTSPPPTAPPPTAPPATTSGAPATGPRPQPPAGQPYQQARAITAVPADLDPPRVTRALPDVAYDAGRDALLFVNGAAGAQVPTGSLSEAGCRAATGYRDRIPQPPSRTVGDPSPPLCIRTSDGHFGTLRPLFVTVIGGGTATIDYAVWYLPD